MGVESKAQTCVPIDTLPDSFLGVYPMPYQAELNPNGGIKDTACVGFDYSFVFTAVVGDSFTLGQTTLPLDSLWLDEEKALIGLPKGLDYACDPPTCVFPKNSKGCVVLFGKPEASTKGIHQMKISGKLYANGSSFGLPLTFPDPDIAPGEYAIVVSEKNEGPCAKLSIDKTILGNIKAYPNPISSELRIELEETSDIKIINTLGHEVYKGAMQGGLINTSHWPSGIYLLIIDEKPIFSNRIIKL